MRVLIAGAGGFIGGHLVKRLRNQGHTVRAVDLKPHRNWWQCIQDDSKVANWYCCDLREKQEALDSCKGMDVIYNLAADMGGIGFIEQNKADCMLSVLINTHLLMGAREWNAKYFYASSACVYHADLQKTQRTIALKESDAYYLGGAMPEDGYGWEKLFSERMCRHFHEDYGLDVKIARFHNIYGPHGSWTGGREKAPAALCRKVAEAKQAKSNLIDVWGDGTITRSFCWIDDCIDGILKLMESEYTEPLNVGSSESVTINELIWCVENAAGCYCHLTRRYDTSKPQGVNGRNSDNTLCRKILNWEPSTSLAEGIIQTYPWIEEQVLRSE